MSRNEREGRYCGCESGAHCRKGSSSRLLPLRGSVFLGPGKLYMDGVYIGDVTKMRVHVTGRKTIVPR